MLGEATSSYLQEPTLLELGYWAGQAEHGSQELEGEEAVQEEGFWNGEEGHEEGNGSGMLESSY